MSSICAWYDKTFEAPQRHHQQRCCSRSCGQKYKQETQRRTLGYKPPRETNWRKYPPTTTGRGLGNTHQRLREQLLPRAIGRLCPFYHTDPQCPGLMLQHHRLALDHITPRALGGPTTLHNVRITHHDCNLRAGGRLGRQLAQQQRNNKRNRYE